MDWDPCHLSLSPALMMWVSCGRSYPLTHWWTHLAQESEKLKDSPRKSGIGIVPAAAPHQPVDPGDKFQHVSTMKGPGEKNPKCLLLHFCPPNFTLKCVLGPTLLVSIQWREFWETYFSLPKLTQKQTVHTCGNRWILEVLCHLRKLVTKGYRLRFHGYDILEKTKLYHGLPGSGGSRRLIAKLIKLYILKVRITL